MSAAIRDITHRKRIEAELKERAAALERSNADLEQFAYVASHDLAAPLRVVNGYVQLLARRYEGQLDSDADEFIAFTIQGVQRMQRLIEDLLAYSRVRQPGERFDAVDTRAAVDAVLGVLAREVEASGAQVVVGDLPTVQGNRTQIEQVFQNLIGNALKFTNSGPPRVDVSAHREDGAWRFSVRDHGIGIDPDKTELIFKMFQRLHTDEEFPGTGIGLPICKRIVENHGGRIAAAPADGGGTVMTFTLPA